MLETEVVRDKNDYWSNSPPFEKDSPGMKRFIFLFRGLRTSGGKM